MKELKRIGTRHILIITKNEEFGIQTLGFFTLASSKVDQFLANAETVKRIWLLAVSLCLMLFNVPNIKFSAPTADEM